MRYPPVATMRIHGPSVSVPCIAPDVGGGVTGLDPLRHLACVAIPAATMMSAIFFSIGPLGV